MSPQSNVDWTFTWKPVEHWSDAEWDECYAIIFQYAQKNLRKRNIPESIVSGHTVANEVMMSRVKSVENGETGIDLVKILYRSARNKIADVIRSSRAQKRGGGKTRAISQLGAEDHNGYEQIVDEEATVEINSIFDDVVQNALEGLDPKYVEVLNLKLAGYSNPDIAAQIGKSVRTIERHVKLLENKILEQLGDDNDS